MSVYTSVPHRRPALSAVLAPLKRHGSMLVLGAGIVLAAVGAGAVPAQATVSAALGEQERSLLQKAEAQLSAVSTLEARFQQVSDNGASADGVVAIKRPGRMRLDYDPPSKIQVIANGTHLIYIDKELDQTSYIGLDSTPAGILLREKVSFNDPDITVTGVRQDSVGAEVDLIMSGDAGAGTLTLVFNQKPFELRQWRMRDAQGITTTVMLRDVKTGLSLDDARFKYVPKQKLLNER